MVEIHRDYSVFDLVHSSLDDMSGIAHHRDDLTYHKEILADNPVDAEGFLRQDNQILLVEGAVALFRGQGKGESITRLFARDFAFEFRKEHVGSVDIVQRTGFICLVGQFAVHCEFVGQHDHFVLFYFHLMN